MNENQEKVAMTNLKGDLIICSKEQAKEIQARQIANMFNNSFKPREVSE